MVPLSKSGVRKHRGFESRPLRQPARDGRPMRALPAPVLAYALLVRALRSSPAPSPWTPLASRGSWQPRAASGSATPSTQFRLPWGAVSAAAGVGPSFAGRVLPGRFAVSGRGRLVDYGAALEMRFGATRRGFESRPLRHLRTAPGAQCVRWLVRSSLTHFAVRASFAAFALDVLRGARVVATPGGNA